MQSWQMQTAKARFSELVKQATQAGPQDITLHGRSVAVVVSRELFPGRFKTCFEPRRLMRAGRPDSAASRGSLGGCGPLRCVSRVAAVPDPRRGLWTPSP